MSLFELTSDPKFPEYYDICKNTGAHFYKPAKIREYTETYFLDEFKAQYKLTYYEDEENLRTLARKRLAILDRFTNPNRCNLLEIGCASGFFLSEAQKKGFNVKGVEISVNETNYANRMGLDVECVSFPEFQTGTKFDVICAFFVIEHFPDQQVVWDKVFSLLNPEGIVFVAVPSLNGPTYWTNPNEWFKTHPSDHFVDYSHKSLRRVFAYYHTKVLYRRPMSYHSERDLGIRGFFPFKNFYKELADLTCYGDTIQVLGKKTRE
jgi:2-polyprenyl-3-methyl-5-hydroxy-6-metoxy-1,4-benzoquinol methylase